MAGLNQKGPFGQGPMTGRRMGKCTNYGANRMEQDSSGNNEVNEVLPEGAGRGMGRARGRGRARAGSGAGRQHRFRGDM